VALQAAAAGEIEVVVARPFNFAGPGQAPTFVCSDFARQVARAEAGLVEPRIAVGNLQARRDFTDVRDMVRGFDRIARRSRSGDVYNLCSGRGVRIESLLRSLLAMARVEIEVVPDPGRMRPIDVPVYVGDAARARDRLDWEPTIPLETTLADTLDYWREQTAREVQSA
jgi:GDP-4-dehydro-6-deoxy-D-mannose reductase